MFKTGYGENGSTKKIKTRATKHFVASTGKSSKMQLCNVKKLDDLTRTNFLLGN